MHKLKYRNFSLWIQTALAVEDCGSPTSAAKLLKMNITTVYRHLDALEQSFKLKLFNRNNSGWIPRDEASSLLKTGREVQRLLQKTESELLNDSDNIKGRLRIAVSDDFAFNYVTPRLRKFCKAYKNIQPELIISSRFSDLESGDVDVAIRPDKNPGDLLVGRRVGTMNHALYASEDYIKRKDEPTSLSGLEGHVFCGYGQEIMDYTAAKWLHLHIPDEHIIARFNSSTVMMKAVQEGIGIGLLPCFVGDTSPSLRSVMPIEDALSVDIWLVASESGRNHLKIKAFFDFFASAIRMDQNLFRGIIDIEK